MSDGMGREPAYLSSHATNRYFIPNWGIYEQANDMMQTDHEYIGELYDYFDAAFLKLFLKNGAICERDEFETKVKQNGMRWYSVEV